MAASQNTSESQAPAARRPCAFAEIAGHQTAIQWLRHGVENESLPHALLLVGPRGVGKRSLAHALAGEIFCQAGGGCGRCSDCIALRAGHHVGFSVVARAEGKRLLSIAQIKELSEQLALRSQHSKGRVVVIEEAERLSGSAQDAFLKTLEEPPPNNVLVLTVNRLDAILPTIRSRCQKLALSGLAEDELQRVGQQQGLSPDTPWFLALGCPGRLSQLGEPYLKDLRQGVLWVLKQPEPDFSQWAYVLTRGLPPKPESALLLERGLLVLQILLFFLRDLAALSAAPQTTKILNRDFVQELQELAVRPRFSRPAELLERAAMARRWLEGSIDPVAALSAVLSPAQHTLQHLDGVLEAEQIGL